MRVLWIKVPAPGLPIAPLRANLGAALVARGMGLLFTAAAPMSALMSELAHSVLDAGGEVIGASFPARWCRGNSRAHRPRRDLRITDSMQERKAVMADLADGFIAMPGGLGTLDEFFEVLTWTQLGIHRKPSGLLNVEGYFDTLLAFLDHAVAERFVKDVHRSMLIVELEPNRLLDRLDAFVAPEDDKLLDRSNR